MMKTDQKTAKMAGILYLAFVVTCILAGYIRSKIIITGNTAATANNIMSNEWLFRAGFMSDLLSALLFILAAWSLYVLLKPVNNNFALLFLILNLGGVAVQCLSLLNLFASQLLLSGSGYLQVFTANQLQAFAMLFLSLHKGGFMIAQLFYGAWLFPLGYLVFKSGFLPRILGILLMMDCFGVLSWFFQFFLLPDYGILSYPGLAVSFVAEISLSLWLLIKGVKENTIQMN